VQALVQPYLASTAIAQTSNKPFIMFETNSASCGGFPGISDSFGATLWTLDYGLQMAHANFSEALLHVGGQDVSYNPFTAAPTNESTFHQWTVGAPYYALLAISEVMGTSGKTQVIDLAANNGNAFTPSYGIYEGGTLTKLALFNYVSDPSGASAYTATFSVQGGSMPSTVQVKYLLAPAVSEKRNITWAGQTFGGIYESDGRPQGAVSITPVQCNPGANTCQVNVPAPGFALVFLADAALGEVTPQSTVSFATTARTKIHNTATVDPAVLATSNGHSGSYPIGSTSKNILKSGGEIIVPSLISLFAGVIGGILAQRRH